MRAIVTSGARVVLATVAGVTLVVVAVAPLVAFWLTNPPDQRLVDLDVYRSGGQAVLTGRPLYEVLTQPPQLLPFTYPPLAALLAVPLALVPWPVAQWAWVVLVYAALAVTVAVTFRPLLARVGWAAPLAAGALVAVTAYLMPVRDQIRFGQVDVMLVALCLIDCLAVAPRWRRGLLVGVATAVKLTPGVFIVYLWLTGRRRAALTAAAGAATFSAVTFLVLPGDSVDYWFGALFDSERLGANAGTTNQSLRGMLLRAYLPAPLTTLLWLAAAALVAYLGFRVARRLAAAGHETGGVAVTGLLAVLVSPVAWIHHLCWVVVALGALAGAGRDRRAIVITAVTSLYFSLPLPWYGVSMLAHGVGPRPAGRLVQDAFGLGALALLGVLSRWRPRDGAPGQGTVVEERAPTDNSPRSRLGSSP